MTIDKQLERINHKFACDIYKFQGNPFNDDTKERITNVVANFIREVMVYKGYPPKVYTHINEEDKIVSVFVDYEKGKTDYLTSLPDTHDPEYDNAYIDNKDGDYNGT